MQASQQDTQGPLAPVRPRLGRTFAWTVRFAVLFVGLGAWKVGVWANHWYIAHMFYADHGDDADIYQAMATLLMSGNDALLDGLVWLAAAAVCVVAAVLIRRRCLRMR